MSNETGQPLPAPNLNEPAGKLSSIDYVGMIGAVGGLITALTGFFRLGTFSSSFAFLFLSFLLFWLMLKNNTVNRLYMLSAVIFLMASMACIYFVSFKTVHFLIRRTTPLSQEISYEVFVQPGDEPLEYNKELALDVSNLSTVTIDLNKADYQILAFKQKVENVAYETAQIKATEDITPYPDGKRQKPVQLKLSQQASKPGQPSVKVMTARSISTAVSEPLTDAKEQKPVNGPELARQIQATLGQ